MIFSIWLSLYPTVLRKKVMRSGNGLEDKSFGEPFFLCNHRPVSTVEQPLVAVGKVLPEGAQAFDDLLTRTTLEDFAKRADVSIDVRITGTDNHFSDRPLQTFFYLI